MPFGTQRAGPGDGRTRALVATASWWTPPTSTWRRSRAFMWSVLHPVLLFAGSHTLHGRWAREFQLTRRALLPGRLVVESRRGFTSHEANPWFAVSPAGLATEHEGAVWFGALAWSGNWVVAFDVDATDAVSVTAGIHNARKFPRGLGELADQVQALGMKFGLWVEPEMVNRDSDLYRDHPDWVFHFPQRDRIEVRNQLVLNFAIDEVRDEIHAQLARLLREHAIDFFKWDCNRPVTEGGWPSAPPERQREVWVRHVRGVYEVFDRLRREFPSLVIETCCSGGGRAGAVPAR